MTPEGMWLYLPERLLSCNESVQNPLDSEQIRQNIIS